MKILKNKVGEYSIPSIGSRWMRKSETHNSHFSADRIFKIMKIEPCHKNRGGDRCIYALYCSSYYDELKNSLKGENCADMTVEYRYEHSGSVCSQCYHTFMEGAELSS